ncbi:amino acid adenylation domain-containing protein [Streptomyces sp. NPDC048291]|uniref:amino acid adenylation domain-containing protein n=1 Tax=Streptomyces sp. NPDC048291 TaxID=3365530 RepID=UPI00371EB4DA
MIRQSGEALSRPLTAAQLGVWFAGEAADPNGSTFNVGDYLEIKGPVSAETLTLAHERLSTEVEACRVTFAEGDDGPVQLLGDQPRWPLTRVDLQGRPDARAAALAWMEEDMARRTDLVAGPLFFAALFVLAEDHLLYYRRGHHIVLDGWSLDLVGRRLADIYSELAGGTPRTSSVALAPMEVLQEEDRTYRASARRDRDRDFWLARLAGAPEPPTLSPRPAPGPRGTQRVKTDLGPARVDGLLATAERLGVAWPELAITATTVYVARLTGRTDVTLGMPISGRTSKAGRNVPGMTANILPLRVTCDPADTWAELARRVRSEVRQTLLHGRYRAEDLLRDLGLVGQGRQVSGPIVNVLGFEADLWFGPCPALRRSAQGVGVDDVSFTFRQSSADEVELIVDANPRLYTEPEAQDHLTRLLGFLDQVLETGPDTPVSRPDLVGAKERALLLDWGTAAGAGGPDGLVPDLFHRQAATTPDAVAIEDGATSVTYAELDAWTNRIARLLAARGVGPGDVVALALPRSARLVAAMTAVLKAGAAYLPLDPGYPAPRLAYMAADARPALLLVDETTAGPMEAVDAIRTDLDDPSVRGRIERLSDAPLGQQDRTRPLTAEHPAYVIYTSGSTGSPKGVVVPQRGAANLRNLATDCFDLDGRSRLLQFVSPSFDMSVADVWMTLLTGGTLVVAGKPQLQPGPELERLIAEKAVSHVMLPPSVLQVLDPAQIPASVTFVVAGEACTPQVVQDWTGDRRLIDAYGPTEASVYSTVSDELTAADAAAVPIGRPVPGFRTYVLDAGLRLAPVGVPGELYIAGVGLALGYLGRPELTAARFVPDPFGPPGSRMYRTGDLVRWTPDGNLVFLNRNDDQVKVRGFRIELGEVETLLMRLPGVARAAAMVREDRPGEHRLAGYLVAADGAVLDPAELRARLAGQVPDHLVPLLTVVGTLPLTPSGKVDRAALPAPAVSAPTSSGAPLNPAEQGIADLFADILGLPTQDATANFFELGGDSLSAARLLGRVRVAFGVKPTMRELFADPTVAGLARRVSNP